MRTFARLGVHERFAGSRAARFGVRGAWCGFWEWVKHWSHGPIPNRIDNLLGLIERPADEPRFLRRVFAFKCVLVLGLASVLVTLGT